MSSDKQQSVAMRAHWKSLFAMTLVSLSSFQYGLDFGIIGGLQAMVPFLQVSKIPHAHTLACSFYEKDLYDRVVRACC